MSNSDKNQSTYHPPTTPPGDGLPLCDSLAQNIVTLRSICSNSMDLVIRQFEVSGLSVALVLCEGMFNHVTLGRMVITPLTELNLRDPSPNALLNWVRYKGVLAADKGEIRTFTELYRFISSGFAVILIDGLPLGVTLGLQGFSFRSVSEPSGEVNLRGSREGFTEPLRINMTLIRRRVKSPSLCFEPTTVGSKSKTDVCIVYMKDSVSQDLLQAVRRALSSVDIDLVLDSGYLQPYLEGRPLSFFSRVGTTERPDTLCAKINEGRIALLLDGSPMALILPYMFTEHFQSFDDYAMRPYYALFIRTLKYLSFFLTILLPGLYVAVGTHHPQLLPHTLLYNVASSVQFTPFSMMTEALLIHLIYEIMREAGLRLPRPIGHAVSIAGGLVIGDVAVRAGLVGTPLIMVLALTAISSFVIPTLYQSMTVLRFGFILVGGGFGMFGISLCFALVLCNLCSLESYGIPLTAPTSPFSSFALRDVLLRKSWKELGKQILQVGHLPGSVRNTPPKKETKNADTNGRKTD